METKKQIIPKRVQELLKAIENVPYYWAMIGLEDLPELPQFSRTLVVSGFNCPDLEEMNDERIEITIKQIFTDKETGKRWRAFNQPVWTVYAHNWSYLRGEDYQEIEVDEQTLGEDGEIISTEKVKLKVSSIKFMKLLLMHRKAHLVDLFNLYLQEFAKEKAEELKKI